MAQAPAMPVFTDALLGDTTDLSTEEFGAYCLILFVTWRNNGIALADDDKRMARITRVTERRWKESLRPALTRFFDLSTGAWRQGRLEKEWEFVAKRAAISRLNGEHGGRPKRLNLNTLKNPAGSFQGTQDESTHTHTHTHKKETDANASAKKTRKQQFPDDWLPSEDGWAYAIQQGYDDAWVREEAAACRDHHRGKGNTFSDLDATWRTWVRNSKRFNRGGGRSAQPLSPQGAQYAGFAIALAKFEQSEADSRADSDASRPLLDAGRQPRIALVGSR